MICRQPDVAHAWRDGSKVLPMIPCRRIRVNEDEPVLKCALGGSGHLVGHDLRGLAAHHEFHRDPWPGELPGPTGGIVVSHFVAAKDAQIRQRLGREKRVDACVHQDSRADKGEARERKGRVDPRPQSSACSSTGRDCRDLLSGSVSTGRRGVERSAHRGAGSLRRDQSRDWFARSCTRCSSRQSRRIARA